MRLVQTFSQHGGHGVWCERGKFDWLCAIFDAPEFEISRGEGDRIRRHLDRELTLAGWAINPRIDSTSNLTITAKSGDLGFQVQTGNMGRAAYDLLKLQHMFLDRAISGAALALPSKAASKVLGDNIANGDRFWREAKLFSRQITVPLLLLEFE